MDALTRRRVRSATRSWGKLMGVFALITLIFMALLGASLIIGYQVSASKANSQQAQHAFQDDSTTTVADRFTRSVLCAHDPAGNECTPDETKNAANTLRTIAPRIQFTTPDGVSQQVTSTDLPGVLLGQATPMPTAWKQGGTGVTARIRGVKWEMTIINGAVTAITLTGQGE